MTKLRRQSTNFAHGASAYCNHRCRCETCRAGWAAYNRALRRRRATRDPGLVTRRHGHVAYTNGCRCEVCREGHAADHRDRRARSARS